MRLRILALLLTSASVFAQRYNFKFYGEEEGLQNLAVQVLLQDRTGFLWAGTQNGLYRYDGHGFTPFGKNEGLPGAHIESLHESVDGTLWVGTLDGLAQFRRDHFEIAGAGVVSGVAGREGIASDARGRLYIATKRGLVVKDGAQFRLISKPDRVKEDGAGSVYVDGGGTVWFGCGKSLCRYENQNALEAGAEQGLPQERWEAILGDIEGNLWVRSEHSLYFRPAGSERFQIRSGVPEANNTFPTLALDPTGRLLVPTYRGLARQTQTGWEIIDAQQGLGTNDICFVMQDREGSIWLGLLGSGLAKWQGYDEWQSWSDREGLSRESIWSITRDTHGRLWVGTQFGLNYADDSSGRIVWRRQAVAGVEMIRTLAGAPDGGLWIGALPGGLRWLDPRSGVTRVVGAEQGLKSNYIRHVMVDSNGRVWASTRDGLFRSKERSQEFEQISPPDSRSGELFHMTMEARDGVVWAAGTRGLARYWAGKWQRFTTRDGLKSDVIAHMAEDPDGSIWIGYYDAFGLSRVTFLNGTIRTEHYSTANGLRSNKSIFLGFDARGWLWAGSDRGVDVFDRTEWRHYGRSDGLIWDDCNSNAFMAEKTGVWVGTSRGLSRFRPHASPTASVPPPVVFTSVKFGDQTVDPAQYNDLPYRRRSLQVRYAALTFAQESSVLFRYRLGTDRTWLETTQRELNYPQLPPGQYTLEVMARNARGEWSAEPARMTFQVQSPWWLSWWFRIGTVLVVLLMGRVMWQRRTYRLEAERNRLETAVAERTRELMLEKQRVLAEKARVVDQHGEIERLLEEAQQASRSKSEFLANVSHEIRTPMNGIIGMTEMVLASPLTHEQREYLDTAKLSAKSLLTILNDVLDFSKIEAGRLELNPIEFALRQHVRETARVLSVAADAKKLTLEISFSDAVPDRVLGDPDRLRQVLLNLIGNAIKFTAAGGVAIAIDVEEEAENEATLRFSVRDTGIGIPQDKQELIFEAFRQADGSTTRKYGGTGLGLAICVRLVKMMGGKIGVESEPDKGSTFRFTARFGVSRMEGDTQPTDSLSLRNMLNVVGTGASTSQQRPKLRVLVAEDNPINQRLAMRLLEKRGHHVAVAATGREAIEWTEREHFDLIVMDVQMPDMDGLEATLTIRRREKEKGGYTPIVALTAHTMQGDRERCLDAGMDNYINKPIDAVKFLEVVESTAAARSAVGRATDC